MLTNGWSLGLLVCSGCSFFLIVLALKTSLKVLVHWDFSSDSTKQIALEGETWLAALLIEVGLILQIAALVLLLIATDSFAEVLPGAMCAAGAFTANEYGYGALIAKLSGVFCYGFWIVLHRLDLKSERWALTRVKFIFALLLLPLFLTDFLYLTLYLVNVEPDVVTSCCGVLFGVGGSNGRNLLPPTFSLSALQFFYGLAVILLCSNWLLHRKCCLSVSGKRLFSLFQIVVHSFGWLLFFILSLYVITVFFSSYIYGMPSHRCPFDIVKAEYGYIGWPIYLLLFFATFCGFSVTAVYAVINYLVKAEDRGLEAVFVGYSKISLLISAVALCFFVAVVSYQPLFYLLNGGEY